jgi:hypothetical protein
MPVHPHLGNLAGFRLAEDGTLGFHPVAGPAAPEYRFEFRGKPGPTPNTSPMVTVISDWLAGTSLQ